MRLNLEGGGEREGGENSKVVEDNYVCVCVCYGEKKGGKKYSESTVVMIPLGTEGQAEYVKGKEELQPENRLRVGLIK